MKTSVKKFTAIALVGGALFGATGAQAHDWDRGDRDNGRAYEHSRPEKKVVHVYKQAPVRYVYRDRHPEPRRFAYREHYEVVRPVTVPGRLIIGFNF